MSKYGHRSEICDDRAVLSMQQMWGEVEVESGATAIIGAVLVSVSLYFPWAALVGYGIYILTNVSPVQTFNRIKPLMEKILVS